MRLRVRWKARRSCLCFAEKVSFGLASMDLARLRREVSLFLESAGSVVLVDCSPPSDGPVAAAASEFSDVSSPASSEVDGFLASFLPDRRSCLSFAAPVAKSTRSGSTWNMSPGLRRYPGQIIYTASLSAKALRTRKDSELELALFPLTLTARCTTNCLACLVLLANSALKMAVSNRLSVGAYTMFM